MLTRKNISPAIKEAAIKPSSVIKFFLKRQPTKLSPQTKFMIIKQLSSLNTLKACTSRKLPRSSKHHQLMSMQGVAFRISSKCKAGVWCMMLFLGCRKRSLVMGTSLLTTQRANYSRMEAWWLRTVLKSKYWFRFLARFLPVNKSISSIN